MPRFAIAPSPIGLRGDVRPRQYLGVVGPRSAWLGLETGEAEMVPIAIAAGTGPRAETAAVYRRLAASSRGRPTAACASSTSRVEVRLGRR